MPSDLPLVISSNIVTRQKFPPPQLCSIQRHILHSAPTLPAHITCIQQAYHHNHTPPRHPHFHHITPVTSLTTLIFHPTSSCNCGSLTQVPSSTRGCTSRGIITLRASIRKQTHVEACLTCLQNPSPICRPYAIGYP